MILAIDPGNEQSAYVLLREDMSVIAKGILPNPELLRLIPSHPADTELAIEMVASYGMAVGKTVFDTVFWIGRFWEAGKGFKRRRRVYRMDDPATVGRCTGLSAAKSYRGDGKMDRLVFEGDLFHLGDESIKYTVVWHDTGFKGKQIGSSSWVGLEHWQEWIVVLATIHDTPGELGGEKGGEV